MNETPRAWVGCLACYNDGTLRGKWVDGTEAGEVIPCIDGRHEEWWVFDHEGYDGLLDGECSPVEAQRKAEFIEALPDYVPLAAVVTWADQYLGGEGLAGASWREIEDDFTEAYQGEHRSEQSYAEELADDLGLVDAKASWPNSYIDWERAANELFGSDYWSAEAPGGNVYVFRTT